MKISISKERDWQLSAYAKAPLELLLCEALQPTSKLLWIVLANQANFRAIDKCVLDCRIGIHRSTRIRCMAELREYGLIAGPENHLILKDPIPVLRKLREIDNESRRIVDEQMLLPPEEVTAKPKKPASEKVSVDYFSAASSAWNQYRPANYSKVNKMSTQLLKAIDLQMQALNIAAHDYENFFSVLKTGIEHSPFWSKDNSSKTLQSIIGIGQPQDKKYQNVYALYNEGLNYERSEAIEEEHRSDNVVLPSSCRKLIDEYDELHYMYFNLAKSDPGSLASLSERIISVEESLRKEKLDPAKFRMKYRLDSWPSDVPEPEAPRERFWQYDDEVK